jgi:hypothetical protein
LKKAGREIKKSGRAGFGHSTTVESQFLGSSLALKIEMVVMEMVSGKFY